MASNNSANQLIGMAEEWYSKLPPLPKSWTSVIVKITPWIALVFGILGIIQSLRFLAIPSPFGMMGAGLGDTFGLLSILYLISSALLLAAFPGTKALKISGWNLLFYSEVVSLISAVVYFSVGGVVGALIGFYILFQIKSHYR